MHSEYQGTIRTAWESLVLLAHGIEPTRTRARGRVNRDQLAEIDLHWHDLRHETACRWLASGLDLRAIQLLLGHADLKTTQRYLNVTDEELRKTMQEKLWKRRSPRRGLAASPAERNFMQPILRQFASSVHEVWRGKPESNQSYGRSEDCKTPDHGGARCPAGAYL
jgi:hypothetical protein